MHRVAGEGKSGADRSVGVGTPKPRKASQRRHATALVEFISLPVRPAFASSANSSRPAWYIHCTPFCRSLSATIQRIALEDHRIAVAAGQPDQAVMNQIGETSKAVGKRPFKTDLIASTVYQR